MVYGYDGQKRVTSAQAANGNGTYQNSYAYANDRLSSVSHNTTGSGAEVTYSFGYDGLGKPTTVSVGSQVLSVNEYDGDRHQKLRKVSYGNGQNVENRYDSYERVTGKKYGTDSGWRYEYAYAANGEVARVKDNQLNRVAWTEYDEANRVEKMTVQDGSGWMVYRTVLRYDKLEHVSSQKEEVGGGQFLTTYAYDWDDRVTQVGYGSDAYRIRYTYDSQGRLSKRRVNDGSADQTATYSYLASGVAIPGLDTNPSTNLVSGISQPGVSFGYGYASNTDNIVSETRTGGSYAGTTTYGYDSLGQLTRVNDPVENATWIYNYDRGGNMVSKVKYAYTTGGLGAAQQSIGYAYGDANWKDKLTAYNGVGITYDAIGNVTGDGTWTYVWEGGRQLKGMSYSGASVTYDYDHNGQRVRKVVNGVETKYWVNGAKVVHVVRGSDWLHVYYDGQGRPGITNYNGAIYYYLYNLQGDVIGLVDGSGNVVVEYKYDAWGKVIGKTGNLANTLGYLNPFRYRGYVYDEETGLYYLRSRYYNPGWGRFINADVVLGQVGGLLSHNVFAYCRNNSIMRGDSDGYTDSNYLTAIKSKITIRVDEKYNKGSAQVINRRTMTFVPLNEISDAISTSMGEGILNYAVDSVRGHVMGAMDWIGIYMETVHWKHFVPKKWRALGNGVFAKLEMLDQMQGIYDGLETAKYYSSVIGAWNEALEKKTGIVMINDEITAFGPYYYTIESRSVSEWTDYLKYYFNN